MACSGQCCGPYDTFATTKFPTSRAPLDPGSSQNSCRRDDPLQSAIRVILESRSPSGLTGTEIFAGLEDLCGPGFVEIDELFEVLDEGARRGTLRRSFRPASGDRTFMVNGAMTLVNPVVNERYLRPLCQMYTQRFTGRPVGSPPAPPVCDIPISRDGIQMEASPVHQPCLFPPAGCRSNAY